MRANAKNKKCNIICGVFNAKTNKTIQTKKHTFPLHRALKHCKLFVLTLCIGHRIHRNFIIRIFRNIGEVGKYLLLDNSTKGSHWWQGWPSGESTCLPQMWPGLDYRTRCHMWIEVVGSLLCHERFFPLNQKPTFDLNLFDL